MDRYASGDDRAFAELYDAIAPPIHRHLRRHVFVAADADDLLQQTLLKLVRARGTFIRGARVRPWAFRIAKCLLIDSFKKRKREAAHWGNMPAGAHEPAGRTCPDDDFYGGELAQRVIRVLARLPEAQRVAFELVRLDGLSLAEAGELLECTSTAVKLRVFRAAEALRAELDIADDELPDAAASAEGH